MVSAATIITTKAESLQMARHLIMQTLTVTRQYQLVDLNRADHHAYKHADFTVDQVVQLNAQYEQAGETLAWISVRSAKH